MHRTLVLTALFLTAPGATQTLAQEPTCATEPVTCFDAQQFHPSPSQRTNPGGMLSADVLPDAAFEVGLLGHYDSEPLVVRATDMMGDVTEDRLYRIIESQFTLHLLGAVGLFDRLQISADIPLILSQSGESIPMIPGFNVDATDAAGFSTGDARLIGKVQLHNTNTEEEPGGAAIALILEGLFPTGNEEAFAGDSWRFAPKLVFDAVSMPQHRFTFSFGYTFRRKLDLAGLSLSNTFDWGFAAHFKSEYIHVVPEIRGSLVPSAGIGETREFGPEEAPTEANLLFRVLPIEQLQIQVGGGVGLFQGFGAPDFRVIFGASWLQTEPADRDGDGYPNDEDGCPDDPEDFDDFEDPDGCPDPDNDQDGILDTPDQCPMEPEDVDQFEDQNGCPDPDNDQDGILDEPDQCPNDPEDDDDFEDEDGCPDPDNDEDGIPDTTDQCPNDPEDMNGVEDEDGCPEIDTDGDGLLDPVDQCPREPEDMDGFEDEDGCPDPDNDQDGILDEPDECPNEPEVVNGFEDEDGCPDEGLVTVTCEAIEIADKVYFETNRAVIRRRSHGLLDQVAGVLRVREDISSVRIEGHTDSRARDEYNLDLSNRRAAAVRDYLVNQGNLAEGRLTSQGFGETRPIESNSTREGRAANRRVEFVIVEQTGCTEDQLRGGGAAGAATTDTPAER